MAQSAPLSLAAEFPAATHDQWLKLVDSVLKGAPFDKRLVGKTYDGIALQPLTPRKPDAAPAARRDSGRPWLVAQRIDMADAAAANAQALEDLMNGANALNLVFRDSPAAYGFGLPEPTKTLLARVFDTIRLDMGVTVSLDIGRASKTAPALIVEFARESGIGPDRLDLRFGYDPIGVLAYGAGDLDEWKSAEPQIAGLVKRHADAGFAGPFLAPDSRIVHAAGGSEAQELAYMLSSALTYLRALEAGGLSLDQARNAVSFRTASDADQFVSIAKLRALRALWAKIEAACGLTPKPVFVAAETAWRMLTCTDPQVNMLRNTVATFAAAVGGADMITVLPHTAALGLPDATARRLARNTQSVLMEETNLFRVADPAAGAGAVEALTDDLAARAWELFQKLEAKGGIVKALVRMEFQSDVSQVRTARLRAVASRKDPLTGTSEFPDINEKPPAVLAPLPQMPASKDNALFPMRLSEPFERLRGAADAFVARTGARPKVFLANLGSIADFTARTIFAKNFFEAGGIETLGNDGYPSMISLVAAFRRSGARIACLCSSDKVYATDAVRAAAALTSAGGFVWMAGRPGDLEHDLKVNGVEGYIHAGCDVVATLATCQRRLGV